MKVKKIKLINKENENEVGIGEFPNNPLKLCASENEEEENVHELKNQMKMKSKLALVNSLIILCNYWPVQL